MDPIVKQGLIPDTTFEIDLDITCSIVEANPLVIGLTGIDGNVVPPWVSVNAVTQKLVITNADSSSVTNFIFAVEAKFGAHSFLKPVDLTFLPLVRSSPAVVNQTCGVEN